MSVSLTITRPNGDTEFVSLCGQVPAEEWVGRMAKTHGFRILTGVYPTLFIEKPDLDQTIYEVCILRDDSMSRILSDDQMSVQNRAYNREHWDHLVARLEQLKSEDAWEAHFG